MIMSQEEGSSVLVSQVCKDISSSSEICILETRYGTSLAPTNEHFGSEDWKAVEGI